MWLHTLKSKWVNAATYLRKVLTTNYVRKNIPGVAIKILSGVYGGLSKIGCPFFLDPGLGTEAVETEMMQ